MTDAGPILVTGCSSGIGKAICERLRRSGHSVWASARRIETIEDLAKLGCSTVALDVTDERSMQQAVSTIEGRDGALKVLVNNAGYGVYGPIEQSTVEELRDEFETNVFGLVRLTQLVLPKMRSERRGRIVNISSVAGRATFPGGAFYQASKFALEALTDSLRLELAPFNINVIAVEPGPVRTGWSQRAAASIPLTDSDQQDDPYSAFKIAVASMLLDRDSGVAHLIEASGDDVARVVERAIVARRPRTRYPVGLAASLLIQARKWMPDALYDAVLRQRFRLP